MSAKRSVRWEKGNGGSQQGGEEIMKHKKRRVNRDS